MTIENKENYVLITSNENSFTEFHNSLVKQIHAFSKDHLIIQISDEIEVKSEDFLLFLSIADQKKENGTSFVVIKTNINADDFPDNFNIVPTLIEAQDILEMEAMERELGF